MQVISIIIIFGLIYYIVTNSRIDILTNKVLVYSVINIKYCLDF